MNTLVTVLVVFIACHLLRKLPYTGIHWGGSNTDHPGWWLIRSETAFVRPLGQRVQRFARPAAPTRFLQYGARGTTSTPELDTHVWYRGWEVAYDEDSAAWTRSGWNAYKGGCDLEAPHVSSPTYDGCLDAVDDAEDA